LLSEENETARTLGAGREDFLAGCKISLITIVSKFQTWITPSFPYAMRLQSSEIAMLQMSDMSVGGEFGFAVTMHDHSRDPRKRDGSIPTGYLIRVLRLGDGGGRSVTRGDSVSEGSVRPSFFLTIPERRMIAFQVVAYVQMMACPGNEQTSAAGQVQKRQLRYASS
jgi:hypothetical protein